MTDPFAAFRDALAAHGRIVSRDTAKKLYFAFTFSAVLPARETFLASLVAERILRGSKR